MLDTEIVQALIAGEVDGLTEAYTRYADRLYDYCARLLDDREAAADAVHDTFLIARDRAAQLRDPEALRPWLYAIARSRCYRVLRERTRLSSLDEGHDMSDDTIESPEAGSHRAELRELVRTAMDGLNPREREIIDLTLRHELSGPQLAAILGVSAKHAHALASTARAQLQRALGTVLVARTRGRDCPALREVLAGWDGRFSPLWRKRINRHLKNCTECQEERTRALAPASLLTAMPMLVAPPVLYDQLLTSTLDPDLVSHHTEFAEAAGPYRDDGFPRVSSPAPGPGTLLARGTASTATVLGAVLVGAALITILLQASPFDMAADNTTEPPPASLASHSPSPPSQPTEDTPATVDAVEESAPEPSAPPASPPSGESGEVAGTTGDEEGASPATEGVSLRDVYGYDATPPGCVSVWELSVSATTTGEVTGAVLTWNLDGGTGGQGIPMSPSQDGGWSAVAGGMPAGQTVTWWVTATGEDGSVHSSAARQTFREACTVD